MLPLQSMSNTASFSSKVKRFRVALTVDMSNVDDDGKSLRMINTLEVY